MKVRVVKEAPWKKVLACYEEEKDPSEIEHQQNILGAKILVETYPVDYVLLILEHFRTRIKV